MKRNLVVLFGLLFSNFLSENVFADTTTLPYGVSCSSIAETPTLDPNEKNTISTIGYISCTGGPQGPIQRIEARTYINYGNISKSSDLKISFINETLEQDFSIKCTPGIKEKYTARVQATIYLNKKLNPKVLQVSNNSQSIEILCN